MSYKAIAMAMSATICTVMVHPLDLIRTRRQAMIKESMEKQERETIHSDSDEGSTSTSEDTISSAEKGDDPINKTMVGNRDAAKTIFRESGLRGFYKGWTMVAICQPLTCFSIVASYEGLLLACPELPKVFANAIGAVLVQPIIHPFWNTAFKMSACHSIDDLNDLDTMGPLRAMATVYSRQGLRALYAGLNWQMLLSVGHIQYALYDMMVDQVQSPALSNTNFFERSIFMSLTVVTAVICSQLISSVFTTPIVTLKTERAVKSKQGLQSTVKFKDFLKPARWTWLYSCYWMVVTKSLAFKILRFSVFETSKLIIGPLMKSPSV